MMESRLKFFSDIKNKLYLKNSNKWDELLVINKNYEDIQFQKLQLFDAYS